MTGEDDDRAEAEAAAAPTMKSFGDAELLRRPTAAQIRDAVDATPTLEDRRPDIEIPSYLTKDDSGRLSGAVAKASDPAPEEDAAGFTEAVDHDVTLAEPASGKRQGTLLWLALGLAAAAVALALLLTGCATGAVAPHTRPELAPTEGLVLIAVDTNEPLQGLVFTLRGSHEGFVVRSAEAGVSGHLLQVPVGEYMLSDLRTTYAVFDSSQQTAQLCVRVTAGRVAYPGHLLFRDQRRGQSDKQFVSWGWRPDPADAHARLADAWPGLEARYPVVDAGCE